nr:hypothetical protein Q903MT_gene3160 [Picea sitchensis]
MHSYYKTESSDMTTYLINDRNNSGGIESIQLFYPRWWGFFQRGEMDRCIGLKRRASFFLDSLA